jgi:hypothetical protein
MHYFFTDSLLFLDSILGGRLIGTKSGWKALCAVHRSHLFILYHEKDAGKQPVQNPYDAGFQKAAAWPMIVEHQ